jgi:hypothetical protein
MRIAARVVTLLLLFCAFLLAENEKETAAPAKPPSPGKAEECAPAKRESAYDRSVPLAHTRASAKFYDVDRAEPPNHPHYPVCLSADAGDGVLWYPSLHKPFKLKISHMSGGHNCGSHPFQTEPCSDYVLGCFSGPARPETVGCVYDVKFQRRGEKESDPHIRITP